MVRNHEAVPPVTIDKHSVLQILLNLLRNAQQAIQDAGTPERIIHIRISRHGDDRVRIAVGDSGVGLAPENLTRIFAHGFTTKSQGHGFGLHSGALTARQLGGTLWAESEGPGHGATFTLELPLADAKVHAGTKLATEASRELATAQAGANKTGQRYRGAIRTPQVALSSAQSAGA